MSYHFDQANTEFLPERGGRKAGAKCLPAGANRTQKCRLRSPLNAELRQGCTAAGASGGKILYIFYPSFQKGKEGKKREEGGLRKR